MSQKEKDFQSKPRGGGEKFGGRGKGTPPSRGRDSNRPPNRGFSDRYEVDRSTRPPARRERDSAGGDNRERPRSKPFEKREFGNEPRREYNSRDSRPPRDRASDDNPYKKREFGSREGRKDFGNRDSRQPRDRDSGDRPYKKREFSSSEGRGDFGGKKPFNKEKRYDRPQKTHERYNERPARREFGEDRIAANSEDIRQKLKSDRQSYGAPSSAYLYGIHAVTQALLNSERVHKRLICTQKGHDALQETLAEAAEDGITLPQVITVEKEDLERLLPRDAVHQDVLLDCNQLDEASLHEVLLTAPDNAKIIVLDQVTDPHNVGAILRSAAAFGATAVVMQTLHAPEVTGTLAKAASGALEHVPLIREVNLSRAMEQLKKAGFFCIGLAEEGRQTLAHLKLTGKTALVLGSEGTGLRRLVAENCDELVKLPTSEPIGSLNVSNAAAVALYELVRSADKEDS